MNVSALPALNATLNLVATCFLFAGWLFIKRQYRPRAHTALMIGALVCSALFLSSYVVYHYHAGSRPYEGEGLLRVIYFAVLLTHVPLATLMVPFIIAAVAFAAARRWDAHTRITRYLWPVWMYVSITGVVIYLMLYQM
jgi:putative membrane protein